MSNVVILQPIAETLEFEGPAKAKVAELLTRMIAAAARFSDALSQPEQSRLHDEFLQLQREHSRATERVKFVTEIFDAANQCRSELWHAMPDGQEMVLLASNDARTAIVVMQARRNCARINCSNFDYFERRGNKISTAI